MLDEATAAEVLLRIGVLTGRIGSIKLIKGSQQLARNLIGDSIAIFESLPDHKKMAEAQIEAALCCSRDGALDTARALYVEALSRLDDRDGDLKALGILRLAMVEMLMNSLRTSFDIINTGAVGALLFRTGKCFLCLFMAKMKRHGTDEARTSYRRYYRRDWNHLWGATIADAAWFRS